MLPRHALLVNIRLLLGGVLLSGITHPVQAQTKITVPPERKEFAKAWRKLPVPPITPYSGPFGGEARAFVGNLNSYGKTHRDLIKGYWDWKREIGTYDPAKDPRPINLEFEAAAIEDWRRMGYNTSYKGNTWTYRVGRYLKEIGMLGAIDQTLWGANGPPPLNYDGSEGRKQRESCGSFFHGENFQAGVDLLTNYAQQSGELDMFKVGKTYVTCSWDEVGLRTRQQLDYRPEATDEFRKFLKEVWFQDSAPGVDSNHDGRTYNAFTGESLSSWDEVQPLPLSPTYNSNPQPMDRAKWEQPGRYKLWIDFHRYFTFEFFRRVNEQASANLPGHRITCYPFSQHFICWPGANYSGGNSFYWYHRLSDVVNVEHCWPEHVAMPLNYAITDRLSRKYNNIVMGWTWFYFGKEGADMYNGPHDCARGLARMMGHRADGIHHWLYSPVYRGRDQEQRLQIAYWHNFLATHYQDFLAHSAPPQPEIAVLMPDWTGYFYRTFQYPKHDWAFTLEGLQNAQLPYEIVTEEELELEADVLNGYKVLYVIGSEWTTPTVRQRVDEFLQQGGVVMANTDSLSLDIPTGKRTDYLKKTFGVQLQHKYKNSLMPSAQTEEEAAWSASMNYWKSPFTLQGHHVHTADGYAPLWKREGDKLVQDEHVWKKLDEAMAGMPREVRGVSQSPLDMRQPPQVRYAETLAAKSVAGQTLPTWGELTVADVVRGTPIAWYGEQVCGVETDNTVWWGTRLGGDIHAMANRMAMHRGTSVCNPFLPDPPQQYDARRPYRDILAYAAEKAQVTRPVTLRRDGELPANLEVLPRVDAHGNLLVVVINHDETEATYEVEVAEKFLKPLANAEAWDLLGEKQLEAATDGKFPLHVPAWDVVVFMLGQPATLAPVKESQAALNKRDLSVPKYFRDRPELNEYEWNTPVPPIDE